MSMHAIYRLYLQLVLLPDRKFACQSANVIHTVGEDAAFTKQTFTTRPLTKVDGNSS